MGQVLGWVLCVWRLGGWVVGGEHRGVRSSICCKSFRYVFDAFRFWFDLLFLFSIVSFFLEDLTLNISSFLLCRNRRLCTEFGKVKNGKTQRINKKNSISFQKKLKT